MGFGRRAIWAWAAVAVLPAATAAFLLLVLPQDESAEPEASPAEPLVGTDDGFRFEIMDGRCGYANVVTATETIEPERDEFCLVRLTVTNEGQERRRLDASCQFLIDGAGGRHTQREDVLPVDQTTWSVFGKRVAPGKSIQDAALYYDVPEGTKARRVEMHGSCGSGGIVLRVEDPPKEDEA